MSTGQGGSDATKGYAPQCGPAATDAAGGPEERRAANRIAVLYPARLRLPGQTFDCQILDIGAGNLRVRTLEPLPEVSTVLLSTPDAGNFPCLVQRHDGQELVLRLPDRADRFAALRAAVLAAPEAAGGVREAIRVQVLWSGRLRFGQQDYACRVLNISLGGAKAQVDDAPAIPSPVALHLDRFGTFACTVAWRAGDHLGLDFVDPPARIAAAFGRALPALHQILTVSTGGEPPPASG